MRDVTRKNDFIRDLEGEVCHIRIVGDSFGKVWVQVSIQGELGPLLSVSLDRLQAIARDLSSGTIVDTVRRIEREMREMQALEAIPAREVETV